MSIDWTKPIEDAVPKNQLIGSQNASKLINERKFWSKIDDFDKKNDRNTVENDKNSAEKNPTDGQDPKNQKAGKP